MKRIDHATAVAERPTSSGNSGAGGYFTDRDPGAGRRGTTLSAEWLNDVQEELMQPILSAGLTPEKAKLSCWMHC